MLLIYLFISTPTKIIKRATKDGKILIFTVIRLVPKINQTFQIILSKVQLISKGFFDVIYLAHVIEQPNFRILNPQYFVYLLDQTVGRDTLQFIY